MANIVQKEQWIKTGLFVVLSFLAMMTVLTGCISDPWPKDIGGQAFLETSENFQAKTVPELIDIFMTNRDWTEDYLKTQKQLDAWTKKHPYDNPPVILHSEQSEAAYELIQRGSKAKAAAPAMIQSLTNSAFLTRHWMLSHKDADEQRADSMNRHWAIQVLQAIGPALPEVVPALVCGLDDPKTGYEAAYALITISQADTNVLSAVITKLEGNPETPEAKNSVQVLNGIGSRAGAAVPALIQLLEHTNACDEAVITLGKIGSAAGPAVPDLLRLYGQRQGDGNFAQRKQIVIALGKIGPAAKEAVPMLQGLRNRPYESFDAVTALWRIDPQYVQLAISSAQAELQAQATMYRNPACGLLGEIGPPAKSTVPVLLHTLNSALSRQVRFNAAWALWRIDPDQKATVVAAFEYFYTNQMRYPIEDLTVDAAGALWQIEPERRDEFCPAVIAMLKQWKDVPAARHARPEMKLLLPALSDIAGNPQYADLRPSAIQMIGQLKEAGTDWWER